MITPVEVRKNVESFLVWHPAFKHVEQEVRALIGLGRSRGEGECLLVTSPSGTGKSTLKKLIEREFGKSSGERRIELPNYPADVFAPVLNVLVYEIPTQPRPIAVIQGLLKTLGDPLWDKGRFHECSHRLDYFLETCGTTTIVLDEVQRLIDHTGVVTSEAVFEELKRVHGLHGLNLVFMGLGRIRYIIDQDVQLRDRWSIEVRLQNVRCFRYELQNDSPVKIVDLEQWSIWRGILQALQAQTGLQSDSPLSDDNYAERLYYATGGVFRRLKILIKRALTLADRRGAEQITIETFAQAYRDTGKSNLNPFEVAELDSFPLPVVDDDYALRPTTKQRSERKAKASRAENLGAIVATALR